MLKIRHYFRWWKYISLALVEGFNFATEETPPVLCMYFPFRTEYLYEIYMFLKPLYLHIIIMIIGSSSKFDKPQIP